MSYIYTGQGPLQQSPWSGVKGLEYLRNGPEVGFLPGTNVYVLGNSADPASRWQVGVSGLADAQFFSKVGDALAAARKLAQAHDWKGTAAEVRAYADFWGWVPEGFGNAANPIHVSPPSATPVTTLQAFVPGGPPAGTPPQTEWKTGGVQQALESPARLVSNAARSPRVVLVVAAALAFLVLRRRGG